MFVMIKGNVEREVETEYLKNKLLALGYTELSDTANKKADDSREKKTSNDSNDSNDSNEG